MFDVFVDKTLLKTTPCRSGLLASPPVRDRPFERKFLRKSPNGAGNTGR